MSQYRSTRLSYAHRADRPSVIEPLEPRWLLSASTTSSDLVIADSAIAITANAATLGRQAEKLDRGLVAIRKSSTSVYLGWRLLGLDPSSIGFNVYRSTNGAAAVKLNSSPLTTTTDYLDNSASQSNSYSYFVRSVVNGVETEQSDPFYVSAGVGALPYLSVPIQPPPGGTMPDGSTFTYSANDASVGDLDGDGDYEIVLKWDPSNSGDNTPGMRANVYIDAYDLHGTRLWRIDLGRNIRAGSHYTQFMVYDFDGDGKAEVAMKTAPGTVDGQGNFVLMGNDDPNADYRNSGGYILQGPEYLTVFEGDTGAELDTIAFEPHRGDVSEWGDDYGNRVDRFLGGVAYLDGVRPSLIMGRGYYPPLSGFTARNEIAAYDFRNGKIALRWIFNANSQGPNAEYIGQGAHSLTIGDVDHDGFDEIIYGSTAIDHDGTGLYSTQLGTGDALHLSDMDPTRPGLEVFMVHESPSEYQSPDPVTGALRNAAGELRDAATGELLQQVPGTGDIGRGVAGDIDPSHLGYEYWAWTSSSSIIYNVDGTPLYTAPSNMFWNFVIHWDADLSHELLDGTVISEWNNPGRQNLVEAWRYDARANNGTKNTPALQADILGDWREEVIYRNSTSTELQVWTTTIKANNRLYTLMHDTQYRESVAAQNSAYNQPPHTSFYLGAGMAPPPTPDIYYAEPADPPRITRVAIGSSQWSVAFRQYLMQGGLGDHGYGLPSGSSQLDVLSWSGLDQVSITFDQDVSTSLAASDLILVGSNGTNHAISGMSWDAATLTATWTLSHTLVPGRYQLKIADQTISNAAGGTLDGEWLDAISTWSGDGAAGGAFAFSFNVLSGDVDQSGRVLSSDYSKARALLGRRAGQAGYNIFYDINGDGRILAGDLSLIRSYLGDRL